MTLSVQIPDLEKLQRKLGEVPHALERETRVTMHQALILVSAEAKGRIHSPMGKARRGIKVKITGAGANLVGKVRSGSRAAVFSQRGRVPGKLPPIGVIEAMVRKLGLVRGTFDAKTHERLGVIRATKAVRSAERDLAGRIAYAIGHEGTKGQPVMRESYRATRGQVERLFAEALKRVAAAIR